MKTLITLLFATVITVSAFASTKPYSTNYKIDNTPSTEATLKITLKGGGVVSLTWNAGKETTTTYYQIEKSVNKGEFKTVAILMGETRDTYSFRDKVKENAGNVEYRVVMVNGNEVIFDIKQQVVFL